MPCETYFGAALAGECDSLCFPARLGQLFSSKSQPSLGKAVQHIAIVLVGPFCHVEAFLGETPILRGVEHRQNNARFLIVSSPSSRFTVIITPIFRTR